MIFSPLDKGIELSFKEISKHIFSESGPNRWMFIFKLEHALSKEILNLTLKD